jgi:hypothetical protein
MGIMAREVEQSMLSSAHSDGTSRESPLPIVIKGIIENGASPNKGQMLKAIDNMMQPDPQAKQIQQQMQQLQLEAAKWTVEKLKGETAEKC